MAEIYLNSKFVGYSEDPREYVRKLREQRRSGILPNSVNVLYDVRADRVEVEASRGRAQRPLIVVKDGKPLLTEKHIKQLEKNEITWSDAVKQGVIEYLDAAEEENAQVAFFENEMVLFSLWSIVYS